VWPLTGSFGPVERSVPRVRLYEPNGPERKRRSAVLPNDARRTRQMEALIASASLSGPNPRRVQRGLAVLSRSAVGKDVLSQARRKVQADGDAWRRRDLAGEAIVRLILDGTAVTVRLDRKATFLSLRVGRGIRRDGQKVLLATRTMGGKRAAAWHAVLDDLVALALPRRGREPRRGQRGAGRPHAPARKPREVGADHERHRAPSRGEHAPHHDADSAGIGTDRGWHRDRSRLASGQIAAMLVGALRTFGQITLRTVDRWQSIGQPIADRAVPLAACTDSLTPPRAPSANAHHLRDVTVGTSAN
jgi:hypothetical protein